MKLLGGCLIASASAAMSVTDWLQAKFQHTQLQGVNSQLLNNALSNAEEKEVMLNLNENSSQMGYSPLSLLVSGGANGLNKADILGNMKNNFKNQMYNQFQQSPINPLLLQYAKQGGTGNMSPLTKDQVLLQQFPDPMGTILRLKRDSNAQVRARGELLMKKMVARNVITDDPYLPDLFIDNDKQKIKDYLFAKQLETADPYMKTLLYRKFNSGARGTGPTTSDKDLIKTKVIASQFGDTINQVTPNDAYLMFKFLQKSAAANQGRIPANIILDVALGQDVADIKANEFEEKFGVSATDYVCAAHEESIRVPCMVNQEIVQPEECRALGCCYNKLMSDGSGTYSHTGSVPICYHNLLGKIGSGIARHMINDDNIKALFGGQMPLLEDLTAAQTWAEKQMPEVLFRLSKGEGDYYGNPAGQMNWWDNMYDSTDKKFSIYATPAPKTKKREWKPHGPTAMPHAGKLQIPEVGGFLQGNDPRVNDLDFIIGNHITKIRAELNSESYTCRLIPPEMMVNCYDNNYDALSTEKNGQDPAAACADLGCCFREVNLFERTTFRFATGRCAPVSATWTCRSETRIRQRCHQKSNAQTRGGRTTRTEPSAVRWASAEASVCLTRSVATTQTRDRRANHIATNAEAWNRSSTSEPVKWDPSATSLKSNSARAALTTLPSLANCSTESPPKTSASPPVVASAKPPLMPVKRSASSER